ncbi:MAG: hypothetical protein IKZ13_06700 [Akkermansia sp.]|nr:hypothetical protein [Akkermansia sp.]
MKRLLTVLACCVWCVVGLAMGMSEKIEILNGNLETSVIFPEPVVSSSVVYAAEDASPEERGLTLFRIEGDERHMPRARWDDQNHLKLYYAKGTSSAVEYKLVFNPSSRYLSGALIAPREIRFRCGAVNLTGSGVTTKYGGAVLVTPEAHISRESRNFSSKSAVHYEFRELKNKFWSSGSYLGRRVAAIVEPAQAEEGDSPTSVRYVETLAQAERERLTPGRTLPAHVLVRPVEELEHDKKWVLTYQGAPGSGIASGEINNFTLINELLTSLTQTPDAVNKNEVELTLHFSEPLLPKDAPAVFAALRFGSGRKMQQTLSQDGCTHHLVTPQGEPLEVQYAGTSPCRQISDNEVLRSQNGHVIHDRRGQDGDVVYVGGGFVGGVRLLVKGTLPAVLDVSVPTGTRAANGAATRREQVHRVALNPAKPQLLTEKKMPVILPLHGKHQLSFPTANLRRVGVALYRVAREQMYDGFFKSHYDNRDFVTYRYLEFIHDEREDEDLNDSYKHFRNSRRTAQQALDVCAKFRKQWMKSATLLAAHSYDLKQDGMYNLADLKLELAALGNAGKPLPPGLYVLRLCAQSNNQVRRSLQLLGLDEDSLDMEVDIPVLVTDLQIHCSDKGVLITRYSTGKAANDVTLTQLARKMVHSMPGRETEWNSKTVELPHGVAYVKAINQRFVAMQGMDVAMAEMPDFPDSWPTFSKPSPDEATEKLKCFLFTERSLYRPGDTVYARGYLRDMNGTYPTQPKNKKLGLKVTRPNGDVLCEQELALNAYGAFDASIVLPEGAENVVGEYTLRILSDNTPIEQKTINCQEFRRDAFAASLTAEMEKIAPKELTLHVQADDYSGVPLSSAKVELKVEDVVHKLVTDENGFAELKLPVTSEWSARGELTVSGNVSNDREEYVVLPKQMLSFASADFRIRYKDNHISVTDARSGAPLGRAQQLRLQIFEKTLVPQNPRALFSVLEPRKTHLHTMDFTIPAHSVQGISLLAKILDLGLLNKDIEMKISGLDAEGRSTELTVDELGNLGESDERYLHLTAAYAEGQLCLQFTAPEQSVAHIFVGHSDKLRHEQHSVGAGPQKITLALRPGEEGMVKASLILTNGTSVYYDESSCFVPLRQRHLDVCLQVPEESVRPGQTLQLSGQVLCAGKPLDCEVTLYAVDAGMLSVSGYECPAPERFFFSREAAGFTLASTNRLDDYFERNLSPRRLASIWNGEAVKGELDMLRIFYLSVSSDSTILWENGIMTGGLRSGSDSSYGVSMDGFVIDDDELPPWLCESDEAAPVTFLSYTPPSAAVPPDVGELGKTMPYLRRNFAPVAIWKAALKTDAEGRFATDVLLPDTLTTYRVFAVAADRSGSRFGAAEASLVVNQPIMITPGMPLFMSTGDSLRLPVSITNAGQEAGSWIVSMSGADLPQEIELQPGESKTLYFDVCPDKEGEYSLVWRASGKRGSDEVQGSCKVRFPAPVLREVHHLELTPGEAPLNIASLFAPEIAASTRSEIKVSVSASPLIFLSGCLDFLLEYPYGCTEQRASALLPWLMYDELAPFCPQMAITTRKEVQNVVEREIQALFARQQNDGGLSYWGDAKDSCSWASAYAAMVLTIAQEKGFSVPKDKLKRLLNYVDDIDDKMLIFDADLMAARALGQSSELRRLLSKRQQQLKEEKLPEGAYRASIDFMSTLYHEGNVQAAFRTWLRTVGRDYRHSVTSNSSLVLLALHDYIRQHSLTGGSAVLLQGEKRIDIHDSLSVLTLPEAATPSALSVQLAAQGAPLYAKVEAKAQPEQTEYPGVTEHGLQVTRFYEVKGADGVWREAPEQLTVGDVVRVTLTCAKAADELKYFVLEDYLPSCMEAINPDVPSQAAGLEPCAWSSSFDHREYLADRVRGFCTRWDNRELLNMTYYARVKRAGVSTAAPAQAQLMYEPQIYGLSPNTRVISRSAQ